MNFSIQTNQAVLFFHRISQGFDVVAVHADVSIGRCAAECVGVEFAADVDAGFFGDAVNHARVFDVFGEHGFDAFAFDLADDGSHLFGGRLGFAAHALRGVLPVA